MTPKHAYAYYVTSILQKCNDLVNGGTKSSENRIL